MSDINQCTFVGRLGQDPEITVTPTGRKKAKFSIAVSDKWTDESGIKHEKTTWVPITAWNRLASTVESYLHKGSQVLVQGKLGFSTYTDKNGIERTSTTVTMGLHADAWAVVSRDIKDKNTVNQAIIRQLPPVQDLRTCRGQSISPCPPIQPPRQHQSRRQW